MSKELSFYITDFRGFYDVVNTPIRTKEDIIKVLLFSIKTLLVNYDGKDEDKGEVRIVINKNSRIHFICKNKGEEPTKYYSFVFPFSLEQDNKGEYSVRCRTSFQVIDSEFVDVLISLLNRGWFSDNNDTCDDIDKFACDFLDIIDEYYNVKGINTYEKDNTCIAHWSIIKTLLTFEPSYVRYDYDPEHEEEDIHPLHHLDIHYASSGTFKLGFDKSVNIKKRLDFDTFEDILQDGRLRKGKCYKLL